MLLTPGRSGDPEIDALRSGTPGHGAHTTLRLAVVIPVLDEARGITAALEALRPLRRAGHEVIVVDGGSGDGTPDLAKPLADQVLQCPRRGRAYQMNMGARACRADVLLFLHADVRLPKDADRLILGALAARARGWGFFAVRLTGRAFMLRVVAHMMDWRSRLTGIATGDQAIFVRKPLFDALGGFPAIPLMEDIALSRRLKDIHGPLRIARPATASSRRWEDKGIWRTIALMWRLRLAFFLGADPHELVRRYYP